MPTYRHTETGQEWYSDYPLGRYEASEDWETVAGADSPGSAAPSASATRAEWDAYATSLGLDPAAYGSKDELQAAVHELGGGS